MAFLPYRGMDISDFYASKSHRSFPIAFLQRKEDDEEVHLCRTRGVTTQTNFSPNHLPSKTNYKKAYLESVRPVL